MKTITPLIALLFTLLLSSCLDTEEKIVINKNNSGVYILTLDLSKMITLMEQMGQQNADEKIIAEKKDSTIYFKSIIDTSGNLTHREKELFSKGSLRIQVDEQSDKFLITLNFPFKHIDDLPELKNSYLTLIDKIGLSDQLKNGEIETEDIGPASISSQKNILSPSQEAYLFAVSTGKVSNTLINKELFSNMIQRDSSLQMVQQMSILMGDINYKTVIEVPGKIKSYIGNLPVLSDDKKTVSFSTSLNDVLNRPDAAEYSVEY